MSSPQHKPKANYVIRPKQKKQQSSSMKYKKKSNKDKPLPLLRPQSARSASTSVDAGRPTNRPSLNGASRHHSNQINKKQKHHRQHRHPYHNVSKPLKKGSFNLAYHGSHRNKKDFQRLNKSH